MEAKNSIPAAHYRILHDLIIVLGYLVIMLTLDAIYGTLLFHAFAQKRLAAHRERVAARQLEQRRAIAASIISASPTHVPNLIPAMDLDLGLDMDMDTDMQQAA
jgi:hypothetical protein